MKKILAATVAASALLIPTAAYAGTPAPIPSEWGGGTVTVELPDFSYPAANGCYQSPGSLTLSGNDIYAWDYYVADLTVTDSIGRISDTYHAFEEYATTVPLARQLCAIFETPGTYTVTGTVEFDDYPYSYTVPVSDTYVITGYTPPPPAPAAAPVATNAPTKVSKSCTHARAALKKAKQKDKPYSVILKAKKKVKRVC